ncbi:MAG TPA: hypothetical protein VJ553_04330 [Candidatus Paceibacterota bacterium]|nr:hypothetical protein [Candidatus Paceibacterota bacterium]
MYILEAPNALQFLVLCRLFDDRHAQYIKSPSQNYVILHTEIDADLRTELERLGCHVAPV